MVAESVDAIPLVDLRIQHAALEKEILAAVTEVMRDAAFIRGAPVIAFEDQFAALHGVRYAIGVSSGTDALHLATRALGLGPGDEVVTVTNTWISTAFAASYVGARPVLVDIHPETYQMDSAALERVITGKTKAVIAVHMFGHPAPMAEIESICRPRGIRIIEDVSQAPLARLAGRLVGTIGDIACFSFYPSKNLGAYGDGGLVLTDDEALASTVRMLADYGQSAAHVHDTVGYNCRLDTIQAAVLLCKLPHLDTWTEARRAIAAKYLERLAPLPIVLPGTAADAEPVYHIFVIRVDERDACLEYLRDHKIFAQVHYTKNIHLQQCYGDLGYRAGDFPVAENVVKHHLSLPLYPEMTDQQVSRVVNTLAAFFETRKPAA